MEIIYFKNKEEHDGFVGMQKYSQFLQSWQWGEFQSKVAGETLRLGIKKDGEIIAAASFTKKKLPIGKSYYYCPRGPVINNSDFRFRILELLFNEIKKIAEDEKAIFLRFDPVFRIKDLNLPLQKTIDVQPSKTILMDLKEGEEELLKKMHQKTRYNIRLAEKKRVKIFEGDIKYFDSFWRLLNETTERDDFRPHGQDYYIEMLNSDPNFIKLFVAEYEGKIIASNIVSFFGDTATYMHGASSNEFRNVMAPYLIQWHVIKEAKKRGCRYYDFYGIDEKKWPGVTRFKSGFGGDNRHFPGTFDYVLDRGWYNIYGMVRKVRRTF